MNFLQSIGTEYPPNNKKIFEEWFFESILVKEEETGKPDIFDIPKINSRTYLPIHFTSYYVNHNYGNDVVSKKVLQDYIDSFDKDFPDRKWFVVLQYDDGILNDISGLDIKVFGSGGGRIDFPIPLVTMPHPYTFDVKRDVFASFAGSMTHPIRKKIVQNFRHRYKIPMKNLPIKDYCELMARSVFSLAPRGYGASSFRICEALQYQSIPIYISDHWIVPGNIDFNEYGVLVHNDEVRNLDKILKGFTPDQIRSKQEAGREIYKQIYTFDGAKKLILDNL